MEQIIEKIFIIWPHPQGQYNSLKSLLIQDGWQVLESNNFVEFEQPKPGRIACLAILNSGGGHKFTAIEIDQVLRFSSENSLIVAHGCSEPNTNDLNRIVSKFGIEFLPDCIIRPNRFKLFHPKEALLEDFISNRGLSDAIARHLKNKSPESSLSLDGGLSNNPQIIYPYGCTIKVNNKKSTVMMTSSQWAIPSKQCICTFYKGDDSNPNCRMISLGSSSMMSDKYLDEKDNRYIIIAMLEFITNRNFYINISEAKTIEIPMKNITPDIDQLIDIPISCFQESEPLPMDKSNLMIKKLFNIDSTKLPKVIRAFEVLGISQGPLTLIKPNLDLQPLNFESSNHELISEQKTGSKQ